MSVRYLQPRPATSASIAAEAATTPMRRSCWAVGLGIKRRAVARVLASAVLVPRRSLVTREGRLATLKRPGQFLPHFSRIPVAFFGFDPTCGADHAREGLRDARRKSDLYLATSKTQVAQISSDAVLVAAIDRRDALIEMLTREGFEEAKARCEDVTPRSDFRTIHLFRGTRTGVSRGKLPPGYRAWRGFQRPASHRRFVARVRCRDRSVSAHRLG